MDSTDSLFTFSEQLDTVYGGSHATNLLVLDEDFELNTHDIDVALKESSAPAVIEIDS